MSYSLNLFIKKEKVKTETETDRDRGWEPPQFSHKQVYICGKF